MKVRIIREAFEKKAVNIMHLAQKEGGLSEQNHYMKVFNFSEKTLVVVHLGHTVSSGPFSY